ncbi:MAG: sigma-54-dependent Fis family transcriptional regulator [Evtepia sp.]|uniref:sigma-54-dependent Fis family transcriptional regulator n=1 Tax=Evtepia sp. TaxID=2773933 RepID=UPI002A756F2A|nr:sigma-54-dependent Fis family transcriptional regulator [Evtepia sp.]MDY3014229.1 sigma-54-dependent Fis family transcriptional regulator [Evtepia sp.]
MISSFDFPAIQRAWERYVLGPEPVPEHIEGVRQEIVDSWRRTKGKVNPLSLGKPIPEETLYKIQEENAQFISIARPYLLNLFEYLRDSGYQITIVDKNGCILDTIFDDSVSREPPEQFRIENGSLFAEEAAGVNGISLCLQLQRPVSVFGPEHFQQSNHNSICYAAPIHDQFHHCIGCVDISGPLKNYHPSALAMLQIAISGIERELSFRQTNAVLTSTLDAFNEGILVLNGDNVIIHHNAKAREVLAVGEDTLIGQSVYSVLRQDSLPAPAQSLRQRISSMECTILNRYQTPLDVSLTVIPADDTNGLHITLIKLESRAEMAHLVYRGNEFSAHYTFDSVIGVSPGIQSVKAMGMVAATTSTPVLIFGEQGTGKEIIAQAIHNSSQWADGPFVSLNCSKLPRGLLESDLFGYEGGVFCGGKENGYTGKFELANGGTLFIDEIDCLSLEAQGDLLQVLQTGTVTRLGGKYAKSVSFKLIVATTTNLLSAVQKRNFRGDLYYRLNAMTITIPPLRERKEDIMPVARHFVEQYQFDAGKPAVSVDPEVEQALLAYHWPNNTREVEAMVEETLHIAEDSVIHLSDLPTTLLSNYYADKARQEKKDGTRENVDPPEETEDTRGSQSHLEEYQSIISELKAQEGNAKKTAAALHMPLSTLYRKLNKYGVNPKDYKKKG